MTGRLELTVVQEEDALLDRLGQGPPPPDEFDDVAVLLGDWRADIVADPVRIEATRTARTTAAQRRQLGVHVSRGGLRSSVAAAVVVAVVTSMGVGAAASQASPDSVLFPLTKVVAHERAVSVLAREDVRAALERAQRQAAAGDVGAARKTLRTARERVTDVRLEDGRDALRAQVDQAQSKVTATPAPAASPTVPLEPTEAPQTPSPAPTDPPPADPEPQPSAKPEPTPTPSPAAPPSAESDSGPIGSLLNDIFRLFGL